MTKPYLMRHASQDEQPLVMDLLNQRTRWLRERGLEQWNTGRDVVVRLTTWISRGETWLMWDGAVPIATITVSLTGDPDFWSPHELSEKAAYVTKMATRLDRHGEGLGALLIRWCQDWAAREGLTIVRWDAWRTNTALQDYYRSIGGRYLRSVDASNRWSGALFEVPAVELAGLREEVVTEQA